VAASVGAVVLGMILMQWPAWRLTWNAGGVSTRGSQETVIHPVVGNGRVVWMPVPTADEHVVEVFDTAGLPMATTVANPPYALPSATGWVRIVATRYGHPVGASPLVALTSAR
jgi:hypothetical protein